MNTETVLREINSLPPEAKQQVLDFISFIQKRYKMPRTKKSSTGISEEPFIGIWSDREDMKNSNKWKRDLRNKEW